MQIDGPVKYEFCQLKLLFTQYMLIRVATEQEKPENAYFYMEKYMETSQEKI